LKIARSEKASGMNILNLKIKEQILF